MIWLFAIIQIGFIWLGWWVYNAYFMEPKHNHPPIFWNPLTRSLLVYGPSIGMISLIFAAFVVTAHGWMFLVFTLVLWGFKGTKRKQ